MAGRTYAGLSWATVATVIVAWWAVTASGLVSPFVLDITNMVPAFTNRDVDAAYAWEPWISRMEAAGGKVIVRSKEVGLNTSDHWVVRDKWAKANPEGMRRLVQVVDLAHQAFLRDKGVAIRATAENLGVTEAIARHIVEINPTLNLEQMADPKFELSLVPAQGNPGAAGMIQQVADFLQGQGIVKARVDGRAAVDGSYVVEYLRSRR